MQFIFRAYLIALHFAAFILLFALLFKSDFTERVANRFARKPTSELSFRFYEKLAYHKDTSETVPKGAVLFIGDSITHQLFVEDVTENAINYGIGGDTTVGVLARLGAYKKPITEASAVVIAIGVNDMNRRSVGETIANYSLILDQIPSTPVFISSILPVDEAGDNLAGLNRRILLLNNSLVELAAQRNNVTYVDNQTLFDQDADGQLDSALHRGDGIHLSPAGLKVWASSLRSALEELTSK
jgi:lysophospholipase L1-like esterase